MHQGGSERTTPTRLASGAVALVICLVAIQIPIAFAATTVESVEGSAYGAYASIDLGLFQGALGPNPSVAMPPDGGDVSKSASAVKLTVGLTEILDLDALTVSSTASGVGGSTGDVQSVAVVNGSEIIGGIIHADEVIASCSADSAGTYGNVTLVGASVTGVGPLQLSPAPNTGISIPGVGTLVLNKQTIDGDGALTVTGLSLSLLPVLGTGTVNIARVVCGVETSAVSTPTTVAPSPSTTEGTSPPGPGTTTTTTPGGPTTTTSPGPTTSTSPGPTTSTAPGGPTTTSSSADSPTTTAGNSTEVSGSALESSGSEGDVSGDNESVGDQTDGSEESFVDPEHDTSVAGLMIQGSGGPPAPGEAAVSTDVTSDPNQTSRQWPTLVDLTILGVLIGAAGMVAERSKLDLRRLLGKRGPANRWR